MKNLSREKILEFADEQFTERNFQHHVIYTFRIRFQDYFQEEDLRFVYFKAKKHFIDNYNIYLNSDDPAKLCEDNHVFYSIYGSFPNCKYYRKGEFPLDNMYAKFTIEKICLSKMFVEFIEEFRIIHRFELSYNRAGDTCFNLVHVKNILLSEYKNETQ